MARSSLAAVLWLIASCALVFQSLNAAQGATVWTGLTKSFTKPFGADPSLAANQDALTASVILTRGLSGGLFNIAAELGYDSSVSPIDTEWATDINNPAQTIASTNYQNLGFTTWISAFGGGFTSGAGIPGREAVVHLITDDIYLDLKFTSWTPGHGGDYTYLRSESPSGPSPTGDYNGNHLVDAADYVLWRKTLTTAVSPNGSGADGNADGTVNAGDYTFWRARFGNAAAAGSGSFSLTTVPEPATVTLGIMSLLALFCQPRKRLKRRSDMASARRHFFWTTAIATCAVLGNTQPSAKAAFHLWQVKEAFTTADGSVQFVEMFDSSSFENGVPGFTLRSNSDGVIKNFVFPGGPVGNTMNKHMLIATPGFGSLAGGVTPDFTFDQGGITSSFFNPNAANITITFLGSNDSMTFTGASLPKDGMNSLTDANAIGNPALSTPNISAGVNSPTNFAGSSGSVNLSAPSPTGDYNGNHVVDAADYAVWRKTLNATVSPNGSGADGNADGTINAADYTFWRARFGNAAGSGTLAAGSIPEPATLIGSLVSLLLLMATPAILNRRR